MKNKKTFYIIFILLFTFIFVYFLYPYSYGADRTLVETITSAFRQIKEWILKIATPAAAVAVTTGALMKKFSFGDEEKIRVGKKLIQSSLFSYAFILAIDLILAAIESLIG